MSTRLRDWWMGGGFFSVATIVLSAAVTWGATIATLRNDQSNVAGKLNDVSRQIEKVEAQIANVRSAQDGVLQLRSELAAVTQRLQNLESDYKTQIQINGRLQADVAGLQADINYLGRK